jgi:ADP-ribosylglycohydrolase
MVHLAYKRWFETQQIHFRNNTNEEDKSFLMEFPGLFSRRAPGNSCLSALQNNRTGTTDNPINNSKGCGTVMRIAPVGLMIDDPKESFKPGCELGALTHGHPSGYLASGVLAAMISNIKAGADVMESLQTALEILKDYPNNSECIEAVEKAIHLAEHSELTPENIETLGGGWVAEEALAISIFCALKSESDFSEGVFAAVNHTGDSDSTGAITGNILGCRLGASAVPAKWTDRLELHDLIQTIAVDLFIKFRDDDDWWIRYPGY